MDARLATQKEVARRAGTSLKTVSRVINEDPLVSPETRERVRAAIEELSYKPSQAARMMRSQESNIIGFLADQVATTYSSIALINGAQAAAWDLGKQLMLFNVDKDSERERQALEQLASFRAEAVIYATPEHRRVASDVVQADAPMILLNCFDPEDRVPAFVPDDWQAALDVTREMIRRGARNPVFLNVHSGNVAASLRAEGFLAAGREAGLDLASRVLAGVEFEGGRYVLKAYDRALTMLASADRPDTILCGQDIQALEVYFAACEVGLRVGQDIAVASFDNEEPICSLLRPGLTTMALPYYEMGYAAMEAAAGQPIEPGRYHIPCKLTERRSLAHASWDAQF